MRHAQTTAGRVERAWLALIALSFGLGGLATLIFPYLSEVIYSVGVDTNVIMALTMGVFLAWNKNWRQLGLAIFSGACLTVVANDLLDLVLPGESQNAAWFLLFSAVAICVAVAGMSILIGGAALATTVVRGVIHYIRNTRRRRLGKIRSANNSLIALAVRRGPLQAGLDPERTSHWPIWLRDTGDESYKRGVRRPGPARACAEGRSPMRGTVTSALLYEEG